MVAILDACDAVVAEAKNTEGKVWSEETLGSISELAVKGSATIIGFDRGGKIEAALVCSVSNSDLADITDKLHILAVQLGALMTAVFPDLTTVPASDMTDLDSLNDNGITELPLFEGKAKPIPYLGFAIPNSLFWFVHDEKLIICTSKFNAEKLQQGLKVGAKRPLSEYRTFTGTRSRIESASSKPEAWMYVEPKHFKNQLSLDSKLTFNMFLPEFHQNLDGIEGSNQIVSLGLKLKFNSNVNKEDSPRIPVAAVDGFIKLRLPLTGPVAALRSTAPAKFPPVFYKALDAADVVNSDFEEVYALLGAEYKRLNKAEFASKAAEVSTNHKNSYQFQELYRRLGGVCATVWRVTDNGGVERVRMMEFDNAESARWFAQQASKSGFMNQQFPFDESMLENNEAFMRSDSMLREYHEKLTQLNATNMSLDQLQQHQQVYVACDKWFIEGPKRAVTEAMSNFGMDEGVPQNVEHVLAETAKFVGFEDDPFFYSYRGKFWQERRVRQYLDLLNFADRTKPPGVATNIYAPVSLSARTVMTIQCSCIHAFNETLGDTIFMASAGDDALHFAVGCFRPAGEQNAISPPSLSKYAEAAHHERLKSNKPEK